MRSTYPHRLLTRVLLERCAPVLSTRKATTQTGFTLVELLIVVVILGVLGAVGIPSYFNQVNVARENAAEQAAMAAAKACTAARVTADVDRPFEVPSGVIGTCTQTGIAVFTSDIENLRTQAIATVSALGTVSLTQPASSN